MRLLLAVTAALLSGCVADETAPTTGRLIGYCPQWIAGPEAPVRHAVVLNATQPNATLELLPANLVVDGRPVDVLRLAMETVAVVGAVEVRATTADERARPLTWFDYRSAGKPFSSLPYLTVHGEGESGHEFDAIQTPLDGTPDPQGFRLSFRLVGNGTADVTFAATYHYRVCGVAFS